MSILPSSIFARRATMLAVQLATAVSLLPNAALANVGATHTTLVSEFASFNTPGVVDGRVEAIAVDGDTVYVGGTFTQIHNPLNENSIIDQPYLFAYSKSTGNIIETFDPQINNSVLALETTGDPEGGVFVGGTFGNLNGEFSRGRFAKIDVDGDRVSGFSARVNAVVNSMVRLNDTLYIGGSFSNISSTPVERLAALDTTTGAVSPDLNLDFGGIHTTSNVNETRAVQGVQDMDITSDGKVMVIIGNFESIDGISRDRLALLELDGQARVSDWNTDVFDTDCPSPIFPQYILGMDISPDNQYLVTATSGYRITGNPACDTTVRFDIDDLTNTDVQPTWVNYTGGDSVYEVVASDHAVYVGGHFRWLNNFGGSDNLQPGGVARAGMAALDPLNGLTLLNWQSDRTPRGRGTFSLIAADEGLYIGDDTDFLNGTEHRKLKFLPISQETVSRAAAPTLPANILSATSDDLNSIDFDGSTFGTQAKLNDSDWYGTRGGVIVGGRLFHADSFGRIFSSVYADGALQDRTEVNLYNLSNERWNIAEIGGMFFNYEQGRLYYTIRNNSQLFWRAFTPASPYFGEVGYVADDQSDIPWGDVRGMDVVDGHLYFALTDGNLYRAGIDGASVVEASTSVISGPGIDALNWDNDLLAFATEGAVPAEAARAELEFASSGAETIGSFRTFEFPVVPGEPVNVRLSWLDSSALVDLRILDANGVLVAQNTSNAGSPKWAIVPAGAGGIYTASVQIMEGSTAYNLQVNPAEQPPAPLADFEFSGSGSNSEGRFKVFTFDVVAGQLVMAQVNWDDVDAGIRVFLRDENRTQIDRKVDAEGGSAMVSAIATSSGQWSVAVQVNEDTTVNYDILVDTVDDFIPPAPLADFEFASSGSSSKGRFQVFNFDVVAGEVVTAQVNWDKLDANVRVFLRDETNSRVDRDITGQDGTGMVTAIATSSGRWSVAVQVNDETTVNYDVLVDTDVNTNL